MLPRRVQVWRRREDRLVWQFDELVRRRPLRDRHELFADLRRHLPILFSSALASWVVARHADVLAVLDDSEFERPEHGPGMPILQGGFDKWQGREYSKKMGIVARRVRSPRSLEQDVGRRIASFAELLAADLPMDVQVDIRDRYAKWLPLLLTCDLLAIDTPERFREWYERMMAAAAASRTYDDVHDVGRRATTELDAFLGPLLDLRAEQPDNDLISDLVHAEYDGQPLPRDEVLMIAVQLLAATMETTERAISSAVRHLARDEALFNELRAEIGDDALLGSFAAEVVRYYSPIQAITRAAKEDTVVSGTQLPAGTIVVALLASANRDEERFARADAFDARRFVENPDRQFTAASDVVSFGMGQHHCVGSRLASVLIVEGIRKLLMRADRIELRDGCPDTGNLIFWSPDAVNVVLHPARRN